MLVSVLMPLPLDRVFDYRLPPDDVPDDIIGRIVQVPFRNSLGLGVILSVAESEDPKIKYKSVSHVFDYPPLDKSLLDYLNYLSRYYLISAGLVLKLAFSGAGNDLTRIEPVTTQHYFLTDTAADKLTEKQKSVVDILSDSALPMAELKAAGISASVVKTMIKNGLVASEDREISYRHKKALPPNLTESQKSVADKLSAHIEQGFSVNCLRGVTGSGKSEVYFRLIEQVLASGQNVLVLLPEIALTKQWQKQFLQRFDEVPHIWHSSLSPVARRRIWQAVADRQVRFLVGARSALALPLENIGLIVVDEEHDAGFKQEDITNYHARDMAVLRAKLSDCPILLVSATPSLETYHNIQQGRYNEFSLPDRIGSGGLADVSVVDLTQAKLPTNRWLSEPLLSAVQVATDNGQQSLLYLNRRGYAPMTLCRACGHRLECPNCSVWLVEHRKRGLWLCHHCDYKVDLQDTCPNCDTAGELLACGPGVERLTEEVQALFPNARLAEMTSDSMGSVADIEAFIDSMAKGEIDIIIGTQLIAKGYHFPQLTVVGVVDADMGLSGGDLRANERTFQLLQQVSGRAGRGAEKGQVFLQTTQPLHPVIKAIAENATDDFYSAEWESRKLFGMPPWQRLAGVVISCEDNDLAVAAAAQYVNEAQKIKPDNIDILGPIAAPLSVIRGQFRYRILIKCKNQAQPQKFLKAMQARLGELSSKITIRIDIDPVNFY